MSLLLGVVLLAGAAPAVGAETHGSSAASLARLALQRAQLVAPDGGAGDYFGRSLAISGNTAVVGAPRHEVGGVGMQGAAYVFVRSGGIWSLQTQLTADDGTWVDEFGMSVAIDGDTALIGAAYDDVGANENQGSAYVFVRSGGIWSEQAKLIALDGAAEDRLGMSAALSGDTAVVGTDYRDVGTNQNQGAAYVFVRSGGIWNQQGTLTATDGAANDDFGYEVALDGDSALVGAYRDFVGANEGQGAAYVFVRSGGSWSQQAKLTAADGAAFDWFGQSVVISGDTALVGAVWADIGANSNQGSAYVFTRSGSSWSQQAKLTASEGAAGDCFGQSVALDGDTGMVGALWDEIGANDAQGSAYVFSRSGTVWSEQAKLTASDGAADDRFGQTVALDGDWALAGAALDDIGANADQGSAYVFGGGAPTTVASRTPAANAAGWNKTSVTLTLAATDDVSGVERTYYRLGNVGAYTLYDPAARPVVSTSGIRKLWFYSADRVGHIETAKSLTVRVDRTRPVTKALANASAARYHTAILRLRVNDTVSPKATVSVKIFRNGVLRRTLNLGLRGTNVEIRYGYTCTLARGRYLWKVYATDRAGNTARTPVGYAWLIIT